MLTKYGLYIYEKGEQVLIGRGKYSVKKTDLIRIIKYRIINKKKIIYYGEKIETKTLSKIFFTAEEIIKAHKVYKK